MKVWQCAELESFPKKTVVVFSISFHLSHNKKNTKKTLLRRKFVPFRWKLTKNILKVKAIIREIVIQRITYIKADESFIPA